MEKRLIRKRPKGFLLTQDCVLLYMGCVQDKHDDDECHPRLALLTEEDRAEGIFGVPFFKKRRTSRQRLDQRKK